MKTFVEKFIEEKSLTELDLDFPFYSGEERNEVMSPMNRLDFVECPSVNIDTVIDLLTDLKSAGSDRVYIADHCDHHGYYFYGVKLIEI